jgi:cellulose synthase/poly-beta-1,6-N-acetylglucosamine synthase-like glycosyltransferase
MNMFDILIFISIAIMLLYCIGVLYLYVKWIKHVDFEAKLIDPETKVTVIVPFRNERHHLFRILSDLSKQQYPSSLIQFILVNDHSEDDSLNIVNEYISDDSRFLCLSLPNEMSGKKAALEYGIQHSDSELILQTDADCCLSDNWVKSYTSYFEITKADYIIGPVAITQGKSWWTKVQSLEFASLAVSTAGAALRGHAIMSNGANLGYRRKTIEKLVDPFARDRSSGDDQFLLQKMYDNGYHVDYIKNKDALVQTFALDSPLNFFRQRARWAAKSKAYPQGPARYTAILIFLTNSFIVLFFIFSFFSGSNILYAILLMVLKSIADYPFIRSFQQWSGQRFYPFVFVSTQLFYSFYITFTALWALCLPVSWKKRVVK